MEQILIAASAIVAVILFVAIIRVVRGTNPSPSAPAAFMVCGDDDPVDDDEGWMPIERGPVTGYATVTQGGGVVAHVAMRRLILQPGWQAGPKGMRPYTKKARAEHEQWMRCSLPRG